MNLSEQNLLFFTRTMGLGGTENVVLNLCEIFKPFVNKIIVCSCGGINEEKLKMMGIRHYMIPDIERKDPKTFFSLLKEVNQIIKKEKITVIHTHHRMAAFYARILTFFKKQILVNTSHNTFYNKKLLTRFAYKNSHLIACGKMVKKNIEEVYGLKNVKVIPNGVKAFDGHINIIPEFDEARKSGKILIGNIGRLSEQKGMEYYIRSIPQVLEIHPDAIFYIIGSGEDESRLKTLANCIAAPVTFLGYRNDIQNVISQLDFVVLSSLWEGLPLTPIEAFSVGKTIVATSVDGTLEIIRNGENGLLMEPKDSEQMAEKICWMIENSDEKKSMEEQALKTFQEQFSFDIFSKRYIDFYRSL